MPNKEQTISVKTHHMNVDYSAYEGRTIKGVVETVLSRGSVVIDKGEFKGKAGDGSVSETRRVCGNLNCEVQRYARFQLL